ncbi:MAG TPA: family 43 glycosylhydrolase [Phycisphaerae bacterium]|nr:family 43 glycosylhydrolase [Phycisphaerae bacterium]
MVAIFQAGRAFADNPLILDQFTADPTARAFDGRIYLYPSHDIVPPPGRARGFCMEDYHAFSSENLLDWQDHGVIVAQTEVPWVNPSYRMWAPDCVTKNGKYYFYFPAPPKAGAGGGRGGGWGIGVAVADKPGGPFKPQEKPIAGANGIDPCVLMDKDGQGYLFYSLNAIFVAKLKDNMVELETPPQKIPDLPTQGLVEGPFAFERNGKYYLSFPHATKTERLEYAMAESPMGPYKMTGVIMDESASGCWTNHHSLVQYKDQWYLFYHDMDLSATDTNRSVHADYLTFNDDGTINKVIPTLRGVGIADARRKIQIDRYSAISKQGAKVSFLDEARKSDGWKASLSEKDAFVQYDRVDFGKGALKSAVIRAVSSAGGTVEIHLDRPEGPIVAKIEISKGADWSVVKAALIAVPTETHNLAVTMPGNGDVDIDWVSFE